MNISPNKNPKEKLISSKEPIDAFIGNLIDSKESIIQNVNKVLRTSLLLQREIDRKHWPNFVHPVHNKISLVTLLTRIDCLLFIGGQVKRAVSAIE